ncbi:MAG: DUF3298 domain-containing protein [Lachnospiraceae bacterium]|nr:DUF3298 domain-containing protein [Lachnospiraceae bacterium]
MLNRSRMIAVMLTAVLLMSSVCACNVNVNVNDNRKNKNEAAKEEAPEADDKEGAQETDEIKLPELKSVDFNLSVYDENDDHMIFESYGNSYLCTDASAEVYPDLSEALKAIDENEKAFYQESIDANLEDAKEFAAAQVEEGADYTYFRYSETALKCADERAVSLLRTENGYLGGAHPDYFYQAFNLDTKTGEDILLSDIITDKDKLKSLLIDKLNKKYPDGNFFDLEESLSLFELDEEQGDDADPAYVFTVDPAGLSFYFGPYDLNSYADGSQQIDIMYEEMADFLKEGFIYDDYAEEGRGDVIGDDEAAAEEEIGSKNVLAVKGAEFTGLTNLKNENNDDGTYYYEDMTEDGMTVITNMCYPNSQRDGQDTDAYAENFVCALVDNDARISGSKQDDALEESLTYPVYRVDWESGENEDTRQAMGIVILTDNFTYFYGFSCPIDAFDENADLYEESIASVELISLE